MKTTMLKRMLGLLALGVTLATGVRAEGTPAERLERGVFLQENEKDLDGAIREFEGVLREEGKAKRQGAEARFRLLQIFLKKGDEKAAAEQWKALKSGYPAANRWVVKAAKLRGTDVELVEAPWTVGEELTYEISGPSGQQVGHMMAVMSEGDLNGKKTWVSYFVRDGQALTLSRSVFAKDGYRPLEARTFMESYGDYRVEFTAAGGVTALSSSTGEEMWTSDGKSMDGEERVLYDNDQTVQIMRTIPLEIGTKYATQVVMGLNPSPIPFDMEVVGHEEITTEAGTFQCARIKTNVNQNFWISRDEHRYLVRIGIGVAKVNLTKVGSWDSVKGKTLKAEKIGAEVKLSGNWLHLPPVDKEDIFRVNLLGTDFAPKRATLEINLTENLVEEARKSSRAFADTIIGSMEEQADELTIDEGSREEGEVSGVKSVSVVTWAKKGEYEISTLHFYAVGAEKAVALRLYFDGKDVKEVRKKADELIKGIGLK